MSLFTLTVAPRTACVEYVRGALGRVLTSGRHRRVWAARYVPVDLREALLAVAPQEVLSADGVQVRTSATVRYAVADPVTWLERTADPLGTVYLATQVALRDALGALTSRTSVAEAPVCRVQPSARRSPPWRPRSVSRSSRSSSRTSSCRPSSGGNAGAGHGPAG